MSQATKKRRTKLPVRRNDEDSDQFDEVTHGGGGELDAVALDDGSGLHGSARDILQVVSQTFRGQAFTVEQLAHELAGTKHASGRRWSEATARIEASKVLASLSARAIPFVAKYGTAGLTATGHASRAVTWALTEHGSNMALADRVKASSDWASNEVESAIAHFEDEALAEQAIAQHGRAARGRRAARKRVRFIRRLVSRLKKKSAEARTRTYVQPHAAARKKRPCRLCRIEHSLAAHRSHRVEGERRRYTLAGAPVKENPMRKKRAKAKPKPKNPKIRGFARAWRVVLLNQHGKPALSYTFAATDRSTAAKWARRRAKADGFDGFEKAKAQVTRAPNRGPSAINPKKACKPCEAKKPQRKIAKKAASKKRGAKAPTKKRAKTTVVKKTTTTTTRTTKKNPGGLLGIVNFNPSKGALIPWPELPAKIRSDPRHRKNAMLVARFHGVPLSEVLAERVRTPRDVGPALAEIGEDRATEYVPPERSARSGSVWRHVAGDQGRGKQKTRPAVLAVEAVSGLQLFVPRRGTRRGFSGDRGVTG